MLIFLLAVEDSTVRSKLEALYIRYHKEMYYIAMSILNNTHDAQDTVQTAILKCADYIEKIEGINSNKTKNLIVTIIKSTATDVYRYKKKHLNEQLDNYSDHLMGEDQFADDIIIKLSDGKYYARRLAELKSEYAEVLTLRYYEELTDLEIAGLLNISHENVRARLSRAKSALKKLLLEKREDQVRKEVSK